MLTRNRKIFMFVFFLAFAFVLVGCGDASALKSAAKSMTIAEEVTEGFLLPKASKAEITAEWVSDNEEVIEISGNYANVIRASEDVTVVLTVTLSLGTETLTKDFTVKVVKAEDPTSIAIDTSIFKDHVAGDAYYYVVKGTTITLSAIVDPEEAADTVTWKSSNTSYATITNDGVLTALNYGVTTIEVASVRSTQEKKLTDQIKVCVTDAGTPVDVLISAKTKLIKAFEDAFTYIDSDVNLPLPVNSEVKAKYFYMNGNEIMGTDFVYTYNDEDREENISVILEYRGETTVFDILLLIVGDANDNDFASMRAAQAEIEEYLAEYLAQTKLVDGDLTFKGEFSEDEVGRNVEVKWDTESIYQGKLPITKDGTYTRPNDNAVVRLIAYFVCGNNAYLQRYSVQAKGYSQEEIIEYLREATLPKANEDGQYVLEGAHVSLFTADMTGKFSTLSISWETNNAAVLTKLGKMNPYLESPEQCTLTATISYQGTANPAYAFTETVEFNFTVHPAANTAQAVALELSLYIEDPALLDKISYFPFGVKGRGGVAEGSNVLPLPKTIGEATDQMESNKDVVITWACPQEPDLFDSNMKLLKQYLRYHEVAISYSITIGDDTATNEIVINVGIAEKKNTFYIGGWFAQYQKGGGSNAGDALASLSKYDESVGDLSAAAQAWGTTIYGDARGAWSGHTYYVDEADENGAVTRYQFFVQGGTVARLTEKADTDGIAEINTENMKTVVATVGGNWGLFFINTTDKTLRVPMSPYADAGNPRPDGTPWVALAGVGRENAFSYDGFRVGWASDSDSKVVFGNGNVVIQRICEDYYVEIPAGGYGMTYKTMYNNATIVGRFAVVDTILNIKEFTPYHAHSEGTPVDKSIVH